MASSDAMPTSSSNARLTDESLARVMIAATAIAPHARDLSTSSTPQAAPPISTGTLTSETMP
jgi:hypothetical protein